MRTLLALLLASASPALAATTVATPATFAVAIAGAAAGDTVRLAPGNYPFAYFRGATARAAPVTIDASDPAAVSAGMRFDGGGGITIRGITLDHAGLQFVGGHDIAVIGFTANAPVRAAVELSGVSRAVVSDGIVIGSGSDGVDVGASDHVDVARIACMAARPTPGAHPDCVQAYSQDPAHPLSYVTVRDSTSVGASQGFDLYGNTVPADHVGFVNLHAMTTYPDGISMRMAASCTLCVFRGNTVERMWGAKYPVSIAPPPLVAGEPADAVAGNSGNSTRP